MFEAITFATQNKFDVKKPIDVGALVECMLFYEKTTVIANQIILSQLIRYFGVERLISLIQDDLLNIVYTESGLGVFTNTINGTQYHSAVEMTSPQHTYQDELRKICISVAGKDGKGRRLAQKIQDQILVTKHDPIILEGTIKSILDQNFVEPAAKIIIKELVPEYTAISGAYFHTEKTKDGIAVTTNIDFGILNDLYHRRVPPEHSSISPAYLLAHLLDVEKDLYFACANLSELASSNISAKLAEQKIDYVLARSAKSSDTLTHFTGFIFKDAKAIRDAINSNRIDLDELISLLHKSKQFKKWVTHITPDANLIKAYYDEVTKETVVDRLPTKSVRWAMFTGLGIAADAIATGGLGTAAGIAIGALDTFFIDKLIAGWKPNQYIENDLKKLISENT
jgi:hypothetical protein